MSHWPTTVTYAIANLAAVVAKSTVDVTIVSPAEGATVNNSELPVTWSFGPGTQASYRVRIYDATETVVVHDTGLVAGAGASYTVPDGVLSTGTVYNVRVDVVTTLGQAGFNVTMPSVTMAFATSVDVTGLTLTAVTSNLPYINVAWTQVTPGGGETFIRYNVYRRLVGGTLWVRVATVSAVATVSFKDYLANMGVAWEYAVTWTATSGGFTLESVKDPESVTLTLAAAYLHVLGSTTVYTLLPLASLSINPRQESAIVRARGRREPSVLVGEGRWREVSVSATIQYQADPELYQSLDEFAESQYVDGAVLVLRSGLMGDRVFCKLDGDSLQRSDTPLFYQLSFRLVETYYEEAV